MKYITLISHSMKLKLKDYKMLFMLTAFPIILTAMFATVFGQAFGEQTIEGNVGIYINEGDTTLGEDYIDFVQQIKDDKINISYEIVTKEQTEMIAEEKTKAALIVIDEIKNSIWVKEIENDAVLMGTLESLNQEFVETIGLTRVIREEAMSGRINMVGEVDVDKILDVESFSTSKTQNVVANMVVAMLIFAVLMGGQFGVEQVFYLSQPVGMRISTAPVRKINVYFCELFACWLTTFLASIIVGGAYEVLFDIGLDKNIGEVVVVIGLTSLVATLLGTVVGLMVKTRNTGENVYSLLMTVMVMVSGGLVPQLDFGRMAYISPVRVCIDSISQIITVGRIENIGHLLTTVGVVVVGTIGLVGVYMKRGGRLYGHHIGRSKA